MNTNLPKFAMVMTSDDTDVKRATTELRNELADIKQEAAQGAPALDRHADALNKEAVAAERAAKANRDLAAAERQARNEVDRANGIARPTPQPTSPPAPTRPPQMPPGQVPPAQPPVLPPVPPRNPPPSNDNDAAGRFRRQNLMYQGFDIGQGVLGGMPLGMVAAQQLPQIAQNYVGQGGGLNGFLKDLGSMASGAARMVTPLTAGIAGLTAAVATGAIAYSGYLSSTKEVETAAGGLGRAVVGTKEEMEAAAEAGAAAAGISVKSARSMEAQFLRTGKIGSENFEQLIGISKDFGATIGLDAASAGTALAEMFADPAKAAQTLYQQYGLIDAATARQVINLTQQNRASEAQALLLKALPSQLADASAATTALGRAWEAVAAGASDAFDWMGKAVDRAVSGPSLDERIAELEESVSRRPRPGQRGRANDTSEQSRELERLREERRQRDARTAEQQRQAEEIARSRAVSSIADASGANSNRLRVQTLRNEIETLQGGAGLGDEEQQQRTTAALEAKRRVLDALLNSQQRTAELDRLDIQIQNERNPILRVELEARRARLELSDQEIGSDRIAIAEAQARNRVIEETISGARSQAEDMKAEADIRSRLNTLVASGAITSTDANRMLQEELTLRPLVAAAAAAEGDAKERLNKTIADLRASYADLAAQQKEAAAQDYLKSQNENIEKLRVEQALIGQSATVQAQTRAGLEAEQRIRSLGIATNSQLANQIREQAAAAAKLNQEIERQGEAWKKVQGSAENTIDSIVDGLAEGDLDKALESIANDLKSTTLELFVKNPLKNSLLGTNYGTGSDLGGLGGIFGRLFGKAADPASIVGNAMGGQSVGSMSVTAANVSINGGSGGLVNGLLGGANDNAAGGFSGLAKAVSLGGTANTDVATYIAQAAARRGIDPTTALNVARSEGGLLSWNRQSDVIKNGIREESFGPFQLYLGGGLGNAFQRKTGLDPRLAANGPAGVDFALDYAAQNGWSSWYGAGKAGISNWQGIGGGAGASSAAEAVNRLAAASGQATTDLGSLGTGVNTAVQGLGNLGSGFDALGRNLSNFTPAATGSSGGGGGLFGWLGGLFGGGSQWSQAASGSIIGLFDGGGPTGGSDPAKVAGLVHEKEFVFDARSTAAIGVDNLYALMMTARRGGKRGYDTGGYVGSMAPLYAAANNNSSTRAAAAGTAPAPTIVFNNYSSAQIKHERTETDASGGRQDIYSISEVVGGTFKTRGSGAEQALNSQFGVRRQGIVRG